MASTTNYGWVTPDDTSLVKDGASAIRTLGSSIDTTTKNLNPSTTLGDLEYRSSTSNTNTRIPIGTSGQGLQVVGGVPAWAASSTSTLTTTGDMLYASAANTLARRAIGSTGDVLTVSGGVPIWAAPAASGGMTLISTTTFNGTPTTVLSSIPATYIDLRIYIRLALPATDARKISMRFNNDSTANRHANLGLSNTPQTFSTTLVEVGTNQDNAVTQSLHIIDIPDYANTTTWKTCFARCVANDATTSTSVACEPLIGAYNQTGAISSLGFLFSTGNATSGTILLYGVK